MKRGYTCISQTPRPVFGNMYIKFWLIYMYIAEHKCLCCSLGPKPSLARARITVCRPEVLPCVGCDERDPISSSRDPE